MKMKLPAECARCKTMFDLSKDLKGVNMNRRFYDILKEKFGRDMLLCSRCR